MEGSSARRLEFVRRSALACLLCSTCVVTAVPPARAEAATNLPVAVDDAAWTKEGMVVDIPVLRNDGDRLRVVSVTQGANGSVLVNGDDTLRYQPSEGFTGLDGFAYTVADDRGNAATARVSVRVEDVPHAPVAENQRLQTDEDVALPLTLLGSDADDDALSFRIQRPPVQGSLAGSLPNLLYTPNADYNGYDSFVFGVDDGQGGSDTGTVSIRIRPVGDAPVVGSDEAETKAGMAVDVEVLTNDGDADGDALEIVGVTQGANGSVLINGDDTLRYQPNEGFKGLDGFTYTVGDAEGHTATATVSVRVNALGGEARDQVPRHLSLEEDDL